MRSHSAGSPSFLIGNAFLVIIRIKISHASPEDGFAIHFHRAPQIPSDFPFRVLACIFHWKAATTPPKLLPLPRHPPPKIFHRICESRKRQKRTHEGGGGTLQHFSRIFINLHQEAVFRFNSRVHIFRGSKFLQTCEDAFPHPPHLIFSRTHFQPSYPALPQNKKYEIISESTTGNIRCVIHYALRLRSQVAHILHRISPKNWPIFRHSHNLLRGIPIILYGFLTQNGYKIWFFGGDIGGRSWRKSLNSPSSKASGHKSWNSWHHRVW